MKSPSKKKSPVGRVKNKEHKAGKFLPKVPVKDGMAPAALDKKMSKIKPGDAKPSYVGISDSGGANGGGKMRAIGRTATMRKKALKR